MGRPFLLGSRPRGPEHRELNELPALGTAPETQRTRINLRSILGPRSLFRRLAHSCIRLANWDKYTRQRQTYSKPYRYRKRTRRSVADTDPTREHARVVSGGPHVEGVGPRPPLPQIASDLRFAIRITNRNRSQIARFRALSLGVSRPHIGTGKRGHYERGLFAGGISRISKISKFSRISRKWSESPLFSTVWGFSRISRISKFSRISRKCTFPKRPLFQKTPFSEPDHKSMKSQYQYVLEVLCFYFLHAWCT